MLLMDSIYVLIVVFIANRTGLEIEFQEFNSKINCVVAMDHILRVPTDGSRSVWANCVPK